MAETQKDQGQEPAESLIDDLIRDILTEAGQSPKMAVRGPLNALLDTLATSPRAGSARVSMLERLLLAQTVATALADAIAPALAESLTPEILKALEHYAPGEEDRERASSRAGGGQKTRRAGG